VLIGVGCDITKINRFKDKEMYFVQKILSDTELKIYYQKEGKQKEEFLAGRFCAKEAIIKALPYDKQLDMTQINIFYKNEKPMCLLKGYTVHISIAHEKEYAISYVCITKD